MEDLTKQIDQLQQAVSTASDEIGLNEQNQELASLNKIMAQADFWQDNQAARQLSQKAAALSNLVKPWNKLLTEIAELKDLAKLSDQTMVDEIKQNYRQLQAQFDDLQKQQRRREEF